MASKERKMTRLTTLFALGLAVAPVSLHAQDSANAKKERRQLEVVLSLDRRAAFDRILATYAAQEIPIASASPEGGLVVGGPVEISHFGALKDNAFFRATIIGGDSTTRVFLSATFASNSDAAWRGAATGVGSQAQEEVVTSKNKGDKRKVWKRLEELAGHLRTGS